MPALPLISNNPTFNKSNESGVSPGYYSRVIFSYTTEENDANNLMNETDWVDGDGIQQLIANYPTRCHGSNTLPVRYWKSGKNIRLRGTFFVSSDSGGAYFNMKFGVYEDTSATTEWLAIQNNGDNHIFNNGYSTVCGIAAAEYISVTFGCDISCGTPDNNDSNLMFMTTNGFYRYNWMDPCSPSYTNAQIVYVPVWKLGYNGSQSTPSTISTDYYNNPSIIMFNINYSTVYEVYLINLTIEELA